MKFSVPLKLNYEFSRVYRRGKYQAGHIVVLHYIKSSKEINRLGVTTSKNIGGSVERNRMRRLLRESYRLNEHNFKKGYDIILLGRKGNDEITFAQIEKEVLRLTKKAGLFVEGAL